MSRIHQFVPMLHARDAVGQHTLAIRAHLQTAGFESEIYVEWDDPDTSSITRPARTYPVVAQPDDLLVYQFATASDLAPWLAERPERLVVNYHNITPSELFAPWDNALARHQVRAGHELSRLAVRSLMGIAVSEFNRADLDAAGFVRTAVIPPVVTLSESAQRAGAGEGDVAQRRGPRGSGAQWLSVGRLAPNKAVEDIVAALMVYRDRYDSTATLQLVGKVALAVYGRALHAYVAELGMSEAVRFAGRISDEALSAAYRQADVLVMVSEHEGFCVPIVEAMAHALPVIAYSEGAVPEVLGEAGIALERKDPGTIAEAVHRLQVDETLRAKLIAAGHDRLGALQLSQAGPRLVEVLVALSQNKALPETAKVRSPSGARQGR